MTIPVAWGSLPEWQRTVAYKVNPVLAGYVYPQYGAAPADPSPGLFYYDTTLNLSRYWNGSAWVDGTGTAGTVVSVAASGGTTGLSFTGTPITTSGTLTLAGTLNIANGGTGAASQSGARTNLGLAIGTDVQGYSAKLAAYAGGNTPSAFTLGIVDSVDAAAWRSAIGAGTSTVTPSALTKTDDTNITLTLGGSPSSALVAATSLTLGWAGTLAVARGGIGTGTASGTALDNITAFSGTGHLVRTGAGAYSFRTATGTANRLTVTNGDGVSGNPTFDISSSYVGQATITTLGTVTTGTWNATVIGAAYGGTSFTSYTAGDMIYATGATALAKLAIGTNNYVLTSNGTAPTWTANTGTGNVARATQPQFTSTIGVGVAASASGSGISFPATQSPSTDPNTLDDYEESTWTPTVSAGSGTITTASATGAYTKIGRLVLFNVAITITTNGTGGTFVAYTLPFTASADSTGSGRETAVTGDMLQTFVAGGTSSAFIQRYDTAYPGADGRTLKVSGHYYV